VPVFGITIGVLLAGQQIVPLYFLVPQMMLTAAPFLGLVFYVVTQLDSLHRKMIKSASTDELTGLYNRAAFFERARNAHATSRHSILLMVDADYFKSVNDLHGHAAGDHTLRSISRRLRSLMREEDVVGRLGGEEFAIVLPGLSIPQAVEIGNRLAKGIDVPLEPDGHLLAITLSVGAVEMPKTMTVDTALIHADAALYRAKANGRARVEVWVPDEAA